MTITSFLWFDQQQSRATIHLEVVINKGERIVMKESSIGALIELDNLQGIYICVCTYINQVEWWNLCPIWESVMVLLTTLEFTRDGMLWYIDLLEMGCSGILFWSLLEMNCSDILLYVLRKSTANNWICSAAIACCGTGRCWSNKTAVSMRYSWSHILSWT